MTKLQSHKLFGDTSPPPAEAPAAPPAASPKGNDGWPKRVTHLDGSTAVYQSKAEWLQSLRTRGLH